MGTPVYNHIIPITPWAQKGKEEKVFQFKRRKLFRKTQ